MEESSLLLRANISKKNWEAFLDSEIMNVSDFNDWKAFLDSEIMNVSDFNDWKAWFKEEKRIYCDDTDKFIDDYDEYEGKVRDSLGWMNIEYNEENEILILSNLFYHENWEPTLEVVSILRGISKYITPNTKNNFLVIYPYWWGDRDEVGKWVDIYIDFNNGESCLVNKFNKENVDSATQYFNGKDEEWYKNCHMAMNPDIDPETYDD